MVDDRKLMRIRYRNLLILLVLAAGLTLAIFGANYAQRAHSYAARPTQTEFLSSQKRLVRQERKEGDTEEKLTYSAFLRDSYQLYFNYGQDPLPAENGGITVNLYFILAVYAVGILVAAMDGLSGFDRFLAGLGTARRKLYWAKMRFFLPVVAGLSVAVPGVLVATYYLTYPARLINLDGQSLALILLYNLVMTVAAFLIGHLLGQLIGKPLVLAVVAVLLVPTLNNSLERATLIWRFLTAGLGTGGSLFTPGLTYWWVVAAAAGLAIGAALLGMSLYARISLERRRALLTAPALRWPLIALATALMILNFGKMTSRGMTVDSAILLALIGLGLGLVWQFWPVLATAVRGMEHVN